MPNWKRRNFLLFFFFKRRKINGENLKVAMSRHALGALKRPACAINFSSFAIDTVRTATLHGLFLVFLISRQLVRYIGAAEESADPSPSLSMLPPPPQTGGVGKLRNITMKKIELLASHVRPLPPLPFLPHFPLASSFRCSSSHVRGLSVC